MVPLSPRILRIYVVLLSLLDSTGIHIRLRRCEKKRGMGGVRGGSVGGEGEGQIFLRLRGLWQF